MGIFDKLRKKKDDVKSTEKVDKVVEQKKVEKDVDSKKPEKTEKDKTEKKDQPEQEVKKEVKTDKKSKKINFGAYSPPLRIKKMHFFSKKRQRTKKGVESALHTLYPSKQATTVA